MQSEEKFCQESQVDETKREFMKKFGKYAAVAPVGMYLLMGPGASRAQASGCCCYPWHGGSGHHYGGHHNGGGHHSGGHHHP